jgi:hypothetical protein
MTLRQEIHREFSSGKLLLSRRKFEDDANMNFRRKVVKKAGRYD